MRRDAMPSLLRCPHNVYTRAEMRRRRACVLHSRHAKSNFTDKMDPFHIFFSRQDHICLEPLFSSPISCLPASMRRFSTNVYLRAYTKDFQNRLFHSTERLLAAHFDDESLASDSNGKRKRPGGKKVRKNKGPSIFFRFVSRL